MDHCENESCSCYFAQDFNNATFAKYFVSMASVSGLRTGPFSVVLINTHINISTLGLCEYMICQFSNGTTYPMAFFCPNIHSFFLGDQLQSTKAVPL